MERLSSTATSSFKFLFLFLWPGCFALASLIAFVKQQRQGWGFAIISVVGAAVLWRILGGFRDVWLAGDQLVIRSWGKEATIPIDQIAAVSQNLIVNIKPITITLKAETPAGRWVTFMPPFSLRLFREDEVVHRLRRLARLEPARRTL